MSSPVPAIDTLARKKHYRSLADVALFLSAIAFVGLYARLADSLALARISPVADAPFVAADARLVALPEAEQGTPLLDPQTDPEPEDDAPPRNDLQRRIARVQEQMGDTLRGRNLNDVTYVSVADVVRVMEADWRWDDERAAGVIITDDALVRFTADSSHVVVNEAAARLTNPVRLAAGEAHLPVKALAEVYGASIREDADTGLMEVALQDRTFRVAVPERLFAMEICRDGRWLRVSYAGRFVKEYPICVGAGNNTPIGHFHIRNKAVWPSWKAYWGELIPGGSSRNPLGARWLGTSARGHATDRSIGIHGTNQPSSIGRRISGGCIRTYNPYSIELYDTIPIGTPVWIHE